MSGPIDFTTDQMQDRADHLAAIERKCYMRNSGVLNDAQIHEFLASSNVVGTSDESQFIGFQVIFGFDATGRDFVAIKDIAAQGTHFVTVMDEGE